VDPPHVGVTARDLAALLGRVINAPTADLEGVPGEASRDSSDEGSRAADPDVESRARAEAARARAAYIAGDAIPEGEVGGERSSGTITVGEDDIERDDVELPSGPREIGELREHPVMRVVYRLAKTKGPDARAEGAQARSRGVPRRRPATVRAFERRGRAARRFLIAQGALNEASLQRALSVMHHFGGRLADTLVGLDILDPLEAYRMLAKQVAGKLMETFSCRRDATRGPTAPEPVEARSLTSMRSA